MKRQIETLVISGGGIRGIVYVGVLKKLEELTANDDIELCVKNICCVSIGCVFGLFYALGYTAAEIEQEVLNTSFTDLKDIKITNFVSKYGLDSGRGIIKWIETFIEKKGYSKGITIHEFYKETGINMQIVATNLSTYCSQVFDKDTSPNMKVTKAIRLSISLPFVFTAQKYKGHVFVDGALINNFPIALCKDNLQNVLGLKLVSFGEVSTPHEIKELDSYITHVMKCLLSHKSKLDEEYKPYTICICTGDMSTFDFDMTPNDKQKMIDIGYKATSEYFEN